MQRGNKNRILGKIKPIEVPGGPSLEAVPWMCGVVSENSTSLRTVSSLLLLIKYLFRRRVECTVDGEHLEKVIAGFCGPIALDGCTSW